MADRRTLLKGAMLAPSILGSTLSTQAVAETASNQWASIIDLDRCDGCAALDVPACVKACREENAARFPEPRKPLQPYWPQTKYEDFSDARDRIDRLTPYNWLYVERIEVNGRTIFAPRRCMHCFDAPCRKICPFGAIDRSAEGAVAIDPNVCFGGAKCRDVCPWEIPQRQAGVGIYLQAAPKFAGGGVMFKCDLCRARLEQGKTPACIAACPKKAMLIGPLADMEKALETMARGRHVYGKKENGGTATWYISSVPFEELHRAILAARKSKAANGRPGFLATPPKLAESAGWAKVTLAAPVAAAAAAVIVRRRKKNDAAPSEGEEQ